MDQTDSCYESISRLGDVDAEVLVIDRMRFFVLKQ